MAMLLPVASAQLPDVSNPGWNIGWEVEEDEVMMDLDGTLQFETKLKFWIDNTRPLPSDYDIEVEMTYPSGCDEGSFSIDSESKVNVGANTNETFEIKISGNGYGDLGEPCPTSEVFSLELVISDLIVAGQAGDGSKTIDQNLRFTPVYSLEIEFAATDNWNMADDIKSGTSEFVEVKIRNKGNSIDSIRNPSVSFRGCPQMESKVLEGESKLNTNEETNGEWWAEIELIASSSHPEKKCDLVFSVVSEGDGKTYSETLKFNVEAIDIKEENAELEETESSDSSGLQSESSSLPAISSLMCIITVLLSAFFRREWQ
ncbi:MAG: hypothetical protein MK197_05550 [Candidatus Poseidoniaceae archaeon]|nr:hypothetical protein [Candidatus Poseidoniaceae archaeon]